MAFIQGPWSNQIRITITGLSSSVGPTLSTVGSCFRSATECGTNPFPILNIEKMFCDAFGGFFVAGPYDPLRCPQLPVTSSSTTSSSSALIGIGGAAPDSDGPLQNNLG